MKEKIALFCDVDVEAVVTARDVKSVYEVPLVFAGEGVDEIVLRLLHIDAPPRDLSRWSAMLERLQNPQRRGLHRDGRQIRRVRGLLQEPERSAAARRPGAPAEGEHPLDRGRRRRLATDWERQLEDYDGILVPGGFGKRGIDGMLNAIRFARERKVPYFGICLGMQTHGHRIRAQRLRPRRRRFHRVRSRHAAPRDLQAARAERRRRAGRHHAAGKLAVPAGRGQLRVPRVRSAARFSERHRHRYEFNREYEDQSEGRRPADHRRDAGRHLRRDLRDRRPSLVPGLPVPSGVQVQADGAASAVQGVHRRRIPRSTCAVCREQEEPLFTRAD